MDKLQIKELKACIRISGLVQGVGFRPFVAKLAKRLCVRGSVKNESGHVLIEAVASGDVLLKFIDELISNSPKGSQITDFEHHFEPPTEAELELDGFIISKSTSSEPGTVVLAPDTAVCDDCLKELFTPGDQRFMNPFISCTYCGPRFSIVRSIPYDRINTSMERFSLCPRCETQYASVSDRRYHAETICCNDCGPELKYVSGTTDLSGSAALELAISALVQNKIIAIKGIGGYHLACSPHDEQALTNLRALKGREHKPFAVMFSDIDQSRQYCEINAAEEALLTSPARPIVLLERKPSAISPKVYTGSPYLGVFLPYTPLQHIILRKTGPLVMTSANTTALPIIIDDAAMLDFYRSHAELYGVLYHERKILRRLDDSVAAVICDKPHMIRRARGYVPLPLQIQNTLKTDILSCGSQQKSTYSLYKRGFIYTSAEAGELDSREAIANYVESILDMQLLLCISPSLAVCDDHPGYESTQYAKSLGIPFIGTQHHYAHIASVMAEHGINDSVIGVAFDGTGYGSDGTLWGGEFLIASKGGFTRAAHLKPVKLFASDESIKQGWKSAACLLYDAGIMPDINCYGDSSLICAALDNNVNTILSSSMGRIFDAVSAILDICRYSEYEGQCAIELENAAAGCTDMHFEPFPFNIFEKGDKLIAELSPCIMEIYSRSKRGEASDELAYRFHLTVCELIYAMCIRLRTKYAINKVALSGGVFLNRILVSIIKPRLCDAGFEVYFNNQYPAGDGCISLGQANIGLWHLNDQKEVM